MQHENIKKFVVELEKSLQAGTFVKLTLGNAKNAESGLQKILVRAVEIKNRPHLSLLYRYETRDETKNFELPDAVKTIESLLDQQFFAAHLFTTEKDFQLDIGKKNARLNVGNATFQNQPNAAHNRSKQFLIDSQQRYLQQLGITDANGKVRDKQQDKWRQINKFVEIVGNLIDDSSLRETGEISVVDMGSGKGYLTFALYDFLTNSRQIVAQIVGVEARQALVDLCNETAKTSGFENLRFEKGLIDDFELPRTNVLIALHACDTATDDAIFKGIRADASLIIAAPCCHKEIRPQIHAPEMLKNVLKHGSLLEREAEIITDGLRALLLEKAGYATKVFEFIAPEHTAKNNLIVGLKRRQKIETAAIERQIHEIKSFYGIDEQRLEQLLKS